MKLKFKPLFFIIVAFLGLLLISIGFVLMSLSGPVDSHSNEIVEVNIKEGIGVSGIAKVLKEKKLIKSTLLFNVNIKLNRVKSLKAGTYKLKKNMNLYDVIKELEKGSSYNPNLLKITFKEGVRISDYIKLIANKTNHSEEEVTNAFNDRNYITTLISKYWFLDNIILSDGIYYPLEGYLAPDTYHFDNKDVEISFIIETMLDEMDKRLSDYKDKIVNHDMHYYLTMASIIELEGTNTENRQMIAGIFENRLRGGMNLGSDVTTYYGLQAEMTRDLTSEEFQKSNNYNTRATSMIGKMPIGPICNPSISSISASFNPTPSDNLFFVADKNGKIYYSKTMAEHDKKINEIKANGDWIW